MRVNFYTLGCKVNQNETGALPVFGRNAAAPNLRIKESKTQ